ncbi:hypothetical protein Ancab_036526 [Ancistrocladus abbreviatus]
MPAHGSRMHDGNATENLMKSVEGTSKFREARFVAVKRGWAASSGAVLVNPLYLKAGIPSSSAGFECLCGICDEYATFRSRGRQAVTAAAEKLAKPEILASSTDVHYMRQKGIPTLRFSPMKSTPILIPEHNEFLQDTTFMNGIKVYKSIINSLSSFERSSWHLLSLILVVNVG